MAPPLVHKRALPPDPPDAGNRVSKPKSTIGKASRTTYTRSNLLSKKLDASHGDIAVEKMRCEVHGSSDSRPEPDGSMEVITVDGAEDSSNLDPFEEEESSHTQSVGNQRSATSLMIAIKGLLDLTDEYLQNLETQHPGIGSDFLALLSDGASRAMRGQRVYVSAPDIPKSTPVSINPTWAKIAESQGRADISFKKRNIKSSPPQGQSKEDRRVMIQLAPDHEARKSGTFELRQAIQRLVPDNSLVSDVWNVPSGVAILAPTAAKAATILQAKSAIEERFGNATVERQETWTTFVIGPIQKQIRCLDGFRDPMDGLLREELAFVQESVPIRYMNWTRRSQNDEPTGFIRLLLRVDRCLCLSECLSEPGERRVHHANEILRTITNTANNPKDYIIVNTFVSILTIAYILLMDHLIQWYNNKLG